MIDQIFPYLTLFMRKQTASKADWTTAFLYFQSRQAAFFPPAYPLAHRIAVRSDDFSDFCTIITFAALILSHGLLAPLFKSDLIEFSGILSFHDDNIHHQANIARMLIAESINYNMYWILKMKLNATCFLNKARHSR